MSWCFARAGASSYLERVSYPVSGMDLLVADTDGDGKPEVYVLNGGTTLLKLDNSLSLINSYTIPPTAAIYLEDSAFARKNIVLSGSGSSYPFPPATAQLLIVDPASGSPIWASTPILGTVGSNSLSFRDVNNDGKLEMVFGTSFGMFVTQ